jgi:hypothetical protein
LEWSMRCSSRRSELEEWEWGSRKSELWCMLWEEGEEEEDRSCSNQCWEEGEEEGS